MRYRFISVFVVFFFLLCILPFSVFIVFAEDAPALADDGIMVYADGRALSSHPYKVSKLPWALDEELTIHSRVTYGSENLTPFTDFKQPNPVRYATNTKNIWVAGWFSRSACSITIPLFRDVKKVQSLSFSGSFFLNFSIMAILDAEGKTLLDIFHYTPSLGYLIVVDSNGVSYPQFLSFDDDYRHTVLLDDLKADFGGYIDIDRVYLQLFYLKLPTSYLDYPYDNYGVAVGLSNQVNFSYGYAPDPDGALVDISTTLSDIATTLSNLYDLDFHQILPLLTKIYEQEKDINKTLSSILPLLTSIYNKLDHLDLTATDIRAYMSTMLSQLLSTMNSGYDLIAQTIKDTLDRYLQEIEKKFPAKEDSEGLTSQAGEINDQMSELDEMEDEHYTAMTDNFEALNLSGFSLSGGTVSAIRWTSQVFTRIWDSLGDYQMVYILPLLLAVCLVIVGRISRSSSVRWSISRTPKGDDTG